MRLGVPATLVLIAMPLSAACSGSQPAGQPGTAASAPRASAAVAAAGEIGIPECDDYFRKYEACVNDKVPDSARATFKQTLGQTRAQWQRTAETPEGRSTLVSGCTQATAAAKQAMAGFGCQW